MTKQIVFQDIQDYLAPYARFFYRSEGHQLTQCYVVGLMLDGERKSVEPLAEKVNASERGMQRLLSDIRWDDAGTIQEYRRQLLSETSDAQGVLAVDDTSFPKKGKHSVGVSRQYCGARGKIESCQIGVSLTYVGQGVSWPYAMDLFIPESWDQRDDPECLARRQKTRMPDSARYRAKWNIALEQIDLARQDAVPHRAVVADAWYGNITEFRQGLVARGENYVVGVSATTAVFIDAPVFEVPQPQARKPGRPRQHPQLIETNPKPVTVSELGAKVEEDGWEHLELRPDSKGKTLVVQAVSRRVWPANGYRQGRRHEEVWLMIEKRRLEKGQSEWRYFFSNLPQQIPTLEIARVLHERFWIDHGYQQLKEELGLDHHEGRSWTGWYRHVLLVFLAVGYLTRMRLQEKKQQQEILWQNRLLRTVETENSN